MIFWQWFLFSVEISGFEQTLPVTDITATLIRNAMSKASALSSKNHLLALCIHICMYNLVYYSVIINMASEI